MTASFLDLEYCFLVVGERSLCLWDTDIRLKNLRFLHSINPSYFEYLCELYRDSLSDQEEPTSQISQHAALALRAAYSQALETFFALIFAAIQAPGCVFAWMNAYNNKELRDLVEKAQSGREIISMLETKTPSWSDIYDSLFLALQIEDKEYKAALKNGFIQTWSCFAQDFLEESAVREYNSIKHGLRLRAGGFKLQIGLPEKPGERPPANKMLELSSSDFGSAYLYSKKIGDRAHHIQLKGELRNWNIESLIWGLELAVMSIKNVQSLLKAKNGNMAEAQFICPESLADFGKWRGFANINEPEITILPEWIEPFTKEEIFLNYQAGNYYGVKRLRVSSNEEVK